jgi:hypothetical protein
MHTNPILPRPGGLALARAAAGLGRASMGRAWSKGLSMKQSICPSRDSTMLPT